MIVWQLLPRTVDALESACNQCRGVDDVAARPEAPYMRDTGRKLSTGEPLASVRAHGQRVREVEG